MRYRINSSSGRGIVENKGFRSTGSIFGRLPPKATGTSRQDDNQYVGIQRHVVELVAGFCDDVHPGFNFQRHGAVGCFVDSEMNIERTRR